MRTAFVIIPYIFFILAFAFYIVPAKLRIRHQAFWAIALLFCASKFACFRAFGGNSFAPELPEKLIWVWGWAYSGFCLLLAEAMALRIIKKIFRIPSLGTAGRFCWLVVLPVLAWGASAAGVWSGIRPPDVHRLALGFPNLPEGLDGYRIAVVADIHAGSSATAWRTRKIVETVNALDADLVCLLGDYSDGMSGTQAPNLAPIAGIRGRDGVVAVSGNHEFYYDIAGWYDHFCEWGIKPLSNKCVFPHAGLAIGGVDDQACMTAFLAPPDPDAAFASATNGEFRILLQHRPYVDYAMIWGSERKERCDLQLSGHTHGGIAPVLKKLVALLNGGMVRGLYDGDDGRKIYVSSGAGQWGGFPVRFFNPCEVVELVLRRESAKEGE